jgi:cardiolipin synthase
MRLRWLPNALTIGRMVLALPLLVALTTHSYWTAFWLALLAGFTDALDGWLAKRNDWRTELGGLLDPIADKVFIAFAYIPFADNPVALVPAWACALMFADKLLLTVCFLGLWLGGQLPAWFVALVIGRDVVIVAGALVWWRTLGPFQAAPSHLSKLNTLLQVAVVAAVLAHAAIRPLPIAMLQGMILACSALTVASGVDYVIRYGARFRRELRNRQ